MKPTSTKIGGTSVAVRRIGSPQSDAGHSKGPPKPPKPPVVAVAPEPAKEPRPPMRITREMVERAKDVKRREEVAVSIFRPYLPAPGVLPPGTKPTTLAMDSAISWGGQALVAAYAGGIFFNGQTFLGYPLLAEMAQRPEYRKMVERIALEMTRKWITLGTKSEGKKSDRIALLVDAMDKYKVQHVFQQIVEQNEYFGRAHIYVDTGQTQDPKELITPIGTAPDELKLKIKKGSLKALRPVEAMWCYPLTYNSNDPLTDDWFNPQEWSAMAKQIHVSRFLTFVGHEVPDLLKPAYSFGGLSLTQLARPYVDNWLGTRQSVASLLRNFAVSGIKTNMAATLQMPTGEDMLNNRVDMFNVTRNNRGLMVLDKETEEFFTVTTPLSTLDALQAQSMEQMAFVAGIPLVVLFGIQPAGLNASSEGEIRTYYDWIAGYQQRFMKEHLTTVLNIIQLSEFGDIDPDIVFTFEPLWSIDEKGKAEVNKLEAETDVVLIDGGVLQPIEARQRLASEPDSPYASIDVSDVPEPPEDPNAQGGGPDDDSEAGGGQQQQEEAAQDAVIPFVLTGDADFREGDHPRAPDGKFGSGGGGASVKMADLNKVGGQKGSNEGGVYEAPGGERFYVKKGKTKDHVTNEVVAAKLYQLAGSPTLTYRPIEGGTHVATEMRDLDKGNVKDLSQPELKAVRGEFGVHAWMSNWDAVGLGGDNQGVVDGKPTTLDVGGSLAYRAQGGPKGAAFGNKVSEIDTLRDAKMNPDAARVFGKMSDAEIKDSVAKVTRIPDDKIRATVKDAGGSDQLADTMVARKADLAKRFGLAQDEAPFEEGKHPRDQGGKFASSGSGGGGGAAAPATAGSAAGGAQAGSSGEPKPKAKKGEKQAAVKELLMKGTTSAEILKATGWPTVSVPQQAKSLGLVLISKKENGVLKYKAVLPDSEEAKAAKPAPAAPTPIKTITDPDAGTQVNIYPNSDGKTFNAVMKDIDSGQTIGIKAQYPTAAQAEAAAHKMLFGEKGAPAAPATAPQATEAELKVAKKATTLPISSSDPDAVKAIKEFNDKYAGKSITDPSALNQKVADYKAMKQKVDAANVMQLAKAQAAQATAAKAEAEAAAKEFGGTPEAKNNFEVLLGITSSPKTAQQHLQHAKDKLAGSKLVGKIEPHEAAMLTTYSGQYYTDVNQQLRDNQMTISQYRYAKALNAALDKLPEFKGTTYRKANLPEAVAKKYQPGYVVREDAFTSSSKVEGTWSGDYRYTIEGIGGRDISSISSHKSENEVLFKSGAKFMVTKRDGKNIHLREID